MLTHEVKSYLFDTKSTSLVTKRLRVASSIPPPSKPVPCLRYSLGLGILSSLCPDTTKKNLGEPQGAPGGLITPFST